MQVFTGCRDGVSNDDNPVNSIPSTVIHNYSNPYDTVGIRHNQALLYAITHMDSTLSITDTVAYLHELANYGADYLRSIYGFTQSKTNSIIAYVDSIYDYGNGNFPLTGLTAKEISYMERLEAGTYAAPNGAAMLDTIYAIEASAVQESWMPFEFRALAAISIAKYSYDFWTNRGIWWVTRLNVTYHARGKGNHPTGWGDFWNFLKADRVGVLVGAVVAGPGGAVAGGAIASLLSPSVAR